MAWQDDSAEVNITNYVILRHKKQEGDSNFTWWRQSSG